MAHETFGPYLLLKKLSEDILGEVFRAGRLRDGNLEQVVLLRTFNGRALNPASISQGIAQRQGVQQLLRSPNLGQGIDAGDFQGIPYVVYDYISGRDLGSLMRQASLRSHPVPTEHALLIAERLALGLSVAHATKVNGQPVLHGFLIPELVMLSNEGENRLLGFETGPALRAADASTQIWQDFGRYLSPEAHAGEPLSATDDVYSLGVVLLELLVGHTLESLGPSSLQGAIAQVGGRGLPNVAELIERSVAPKEQRIVNAAAWHQDLSRLALDRQSSSTPFHLAFYMHNLFRDEIERESEEIEHERSIDFSQQRLTAAPALGSSAILHNADAERPLSAPSLTGSTPDLSATAEGGAPAVDNSQDDDFAAAIGAAPNVPTPAATTAATSNATKPTKAEPTKSSSKMPLLIAALVLLLATGAYFGWKWWSGKDSAPNGTQIASATEPTEIAGGAASDPADLEAGGPGGPNGTEIDGASDPLSGSDGSEPVPGGGPVEDARKLAEGVESDTVDPDAVQRENLMAELDRLVDERTKSAALGLKQEYDDEVKQLRDQLAEVERQKAEEERLEQEAEEARKQALIDEQRKKQEAATKAEADRKALAAAQAAEAKKAADAGASTEAPAPRKVRVGELVQAGAGVSRPRLSSDIKPVYPFAAQRLRKEADVSVDVLVDENGKVIDTRMGEKAGFGFDDAARAAASRAEFVPASTQGVKVKMWTTIKVQFRLEG